MNATATIYQKLSQLEQDFQRLKIQTYRALPRPIRASSPYLDKAIYQAVKGAHQEIWQKRYAKKLRIFVDTNALLAGLNPMRS